MNKLREKILLIIIGLILFVWATIAWIVDPIFNDFSDIYQKLNLAHAQLQKQNYFLQQKDQLEKDFTQISSTISSDKQTYQEEMASILSIVESEARKKNVEISDLKPISTMSSLKNSKIVISIDGTTQLSDILNLIYSLEIEYPFHIESLKINSTEKSDQILNINLIISKIRV